MKWSTFVFLILVCLSILFVKQHALVDIPAAILVGEFFCQSGKKWEPERIMYRLENTWNQSGIKISSRKILINGCGNGVKK